MCYHFVTNLCGMRYANEVPASQDLMLIYKTSSKKVQQLIQDGEIPKIEYIVEFDTKEEVAEYEYQFLKRCFRDRVWLNQALNHPFRKCNQKDDAKYGAELNQKISGKPPRDRKKRSSKKVTQKPYDHSKVYGAKPKLKIKQKKSKMSRAKRKHLRKIKGSIFYNGHD